MKNILIIFIVILNLNSVSQAKIKISFGLYSSDKPSLMVQQFRPLLNYLETALSIKLRDDVKIKTQVFATYELGINAIATGMVDFSRLGPASYVFAKSQQPDLSILAVENQKGRTFFYGIIAIAEDSDIVAVNDLNGRSFAFGDERSTIGRYLSQNYLVTYGIKAGDLANYSYLGRHDKVGMAVAAKAFDAGALKQSTFKKLVANGHKIKKLADFKNVTKPWVASKNLNVAIKAALVDALLSLKDQKILTQFGKSGFSIVTDSHFDVIRTAIFKNSHFFE
ncbi:MAG: PhnD/SsuA/transferrin family substrate-binding protein [Rhizobiales bacterium]|nr:PhnD/SsuA/transferrin family substrate-binding protein [Hyphomicrobiales bacterium]NRB13894.1 PhnD/SsuA/transferrin family substrate-binding protein [Hyphomicrobiales bacterium]